MTKLTHEDEHAIDRLTLHLLQDAYFDVVAVLRGAQPKAAAAILAVMEQRVANALTRMCRDDSEGTGSRGIAFAVGERLGDIMEQAHGHVSTAQVA
ncbi:hypothetical protein [Methylobacterium sp. J-076]|uniref:hypothetical protein n=1 Tax=Methylobacterium sp. J-076 TaxID=2836655 RepID=UPI001FBADBF7|nr:hypothetical protein [Methylobacterium sp. J-076]MCJ2015378.1 hypothetical protein [Methylobacterium sp. J-076]